MQTDEASLLATIAARGVRGELVKDSGGQIFVDLVVRGKGPDDRARHRGIVVQIQRLAGGFGGASTIPGAGGDVSYSGGSGQECVGLKICSCDRHSEKDSVSADPAVYEIFTSATRAYGVIWKMG